MKSLSKIFFSLFILFIFFPSLISTVRLSELSYISGGAIRAITLTPEGKLIGGRGGHTITIWQSGDKGANWEQIGTVAENPDLVYGDIMLLSIPNTKIIFCTFRIHNDITGLWSVTVCRSDNSGFDWVFDSTIEGERKLFVGAPFLFLNEGGDLQIYYDNEEVPKNEGNAGSQWITMKSRNGIDGEWDKLGLVVASRDSNIKAACRDGMATVVGLGNNRIMLVTEGIEDSDSGGTRSNVIRSIQSFDGGKSWNYNGRQIIYQSFIHEESKRRYNAYCPYASRVGDGPVGVVFCTDEDFGGDPDQSYEQVDKRRTHIKYIRTLSTFEEWGNKEDIWTEGNKAYAPGIIEIEKNKLVVSIDHLNGKVRYLLFDVLG